MVLPTRRDVLAAAAVTVLGHGAVRAQESTRTFRLAMLVSDPRQAPQWLAFFDELDKAGVVEGKNLTVDFCVRGSHEQNASSAAELVRSAPDALVTGAPQIAEVQAATRTIPTLGIFDDMVAMGLVSSLARPGGNFTGISILASELDGKRQEILMELVPASRRMAALADPNTKRPNDRDSAERHRSTRGHVVDLSGLRPWSDHGCYRSGAGGGRHGTQRIGVTHAPH